MFLLLKEKLQATCIEVNDRLNNLEDVYDENQLQIKLNNLELEFENYCNEKRKQAEQGYQMLVDNTFKHLSNSWCFFYSKKTIQR